MWKSTSHLILAVALSFCAAVPSFGAGSKDYILTIDGTDYPIGLGGTVTVKNASGTPVVIKLGKAAIATYEDDLVSFQHKGDLGVNSTDLSKSIKQHMMATATGTLVLVQEYLSLDPSSITPLMLSELTKESVKAGGKVQQENTSRKLPNGRVLNGLKATLTEYGGTEVSLEVLAYGTPDRGILAVTRIDGDNLAADTPILELFWKSLDVKF